MAIDILNNTDVILEEYYIDIIDSVVKKSLETVNFSAEVEVSISIVTNEQIKQLNNDYRGINKETDVLSFPMFSFNDNNYDLNPFTENSLGDIVISIEKVKSQAEEFGHSFAREIAFLTAHSMLHLLGYDHETHEDEELMFSITEKILTDLGYTR